MKPYLQNIDVATADPDGLADGVSSVLVQVLLTGTLSSGANLDGIADGNDSAGTSIAIDGTLSSGGIYQDTTGNARHIMILDLGADDQTGATYLISGTGADGVTLSENVAGPDASERVSTLNRFSTVTSIAITSPVVGSTVDVGVNGIFVSSDGLAHRLDVIDVGGDNQTGATYTVNGTDADDIFETEDFVGPGSGLTVETTKYFKTVTSITIASPIATSQIDVGTVDEAVSKTVPLNYRNDIAATYAVDVTGTIDYTVQETIDKIHDYANPSVDSSWFPLTALSAKTADLMAIGTANTSACRLVVNSYTTAAEIQFTVMQNEST